VNKNSVIEKDGIHDGHINRNIRLALAIIDLSQPYIFITKYDERDDDTVQITWQVNGCHTLNEARVYVDGQVKDMMKAGDKGTCNYVLGRSQNQTTFMNVVSKN